jgi:hypothetical protein
MKYYKKVDSHGNLSWVAELKSCSDDVAVEITRDEYLKLITNGIDDECSISISD